MTAELGEKQSSEPGQRPDSGNILVQKNSRADTSIVDDNTVNHIDQMSNNQYQNQVSGENSDRVKIALQRLATGPISKNTQIKVQKSKDYQKIQEQRAISNSKVVSMNSIYEIVSAQKEQAKTLKESIVKSVMQDRESSAIA